MLGQHELKPGESTTLKIIYNTLKFPGKFEKYVTVFSDLADRGKTVITLKGHVTPIPMGVMEVKPRKLSAGEIGVGEPAKLVIPVKNTGDAPLEVTKVESKKHGTVSFDAAACDAMRIPPGEVRKFTVEIVGEKPGRYLDYILIHSSDARNVTDKGYKVVVVATVK